MIRILTSFILDHLVSEKETWLNSRIFFRDKQKPKQIVHFDCHMRDQETDPVKLRQVRVAKGVRLDYREFSKDRLFIFNGPFVFFNVCDGGTVDDESDDSVAKQLRESGADAVLAA